MKTVKIRNVEIGAGIPKICVPIVGVTKEDILAQAKALQSLPTDVVEWRIDWFENVFDFDALKDALTDLRAVLGGLPLLMTFRTSKEGGEKAIDAEDYAELNIKAAQTGLVDLIDVEVFTGDEIVSRIIREAHAAGVKVVASNHDFDKTPDKDDIVSRLRKMQAMDADIPKIAVMPRSKRDVLTLLAATEDDGTILGQLVVDDVAPLLAGVVLALDAVCAVLVAEVGGHFPGDAHCRGTRCSLHEVHLDRLGAVQRQRGGRKGTGARGVVHQVGVLHLAPAEVHGRQLRHVVVQRLGGVFGDGHGRAGRPLPVVHHLGHCRGDTSCYGMLAVRAEGQQNVIRIVLGPCGMYQWGNGGA